MIISAFAPFRLDLTAGFPDVPPLYREQRGAVLNVALKDGIETEYAPQLGPSSSFDGRVAAALEGKLGVSGWGVRSRATGLHVGTGLGSSGATSVAVTASIGRRLGEEWSVVSVCNEAVWAERSAGNWCGHQDQLASCQGGIGLVECEGASCDRRPGSSDALSLVGSMLLLAHVGGGRVSGGLVAEVSERVRNERGALAILAAMTEVADHAWSELAENRVEELGAWVSASAHLMDALDDRIVDRELMTRFRLEGALGAKPCGAGGPGAMWLVVVPADGRSRVARGLRSSGITCLAPQLAREGVRTGVDDGGQAKAFGWSDTPRGARSLPKTNGGRDPLAGVPTRA